MFKILERSKIMLETGKWYAVPWWEEDKYYNNSLTTKEKIEIAFNELIRVFDDKWVLEQRIRNSNRLPYFSHPFIEKYLVAEGFLPFESLYSLGWDLYIVSKANLIEDLERRLKNPKEYWEAAAFELKLLSEFLQQGFKIEKNHSSGKGKKGGCNCDFKISKGNEIIFAEVKRLRQFHLHNEITIQNGNRSLWNQSLNDNTEAKNDFSKPLSHKIEVNKIFRHIRDATNNQLPNEGPGIVIVELPLIVEKEFFEYALKNRLWNRGKNPHQKYAHLSAIVLVKVSFKDFIHNDIGIILNPKAKINISSYNAIESIRSLTNTYTKYP